MNNILITGGTGSFGQEFVAYLLGRDSVFDKIFVYSRDEHKQERMDDRLKMYIGHDRLRFLIGDVRDKDRLRLAMQECTHVVHAAALKVVPTGEYNPIEFIKTNIDGARNIVEIMCEQGRNFGRLIALSTDKAVAPVNLYGATKMCMEKLFIAGNSLAGRRDIKFNIVRYGNVANSNGSVIPKFKHCREEGLPIPITDERMTRYWITLEEAVAFTYNKLMYRAGIGEVYIPEMPSFNIMDLAAAFSPTGKVPIEIIGIREGEKLHEQIDVDKFSNTNKRFLSCQELREKLVQLGVIETH